MRKKTIWIFAVVALLIAVLIVSAGCDTTGGGKPNTPSTEENSDGFVKGETNIDLMTEDLIGGIVSALRPVNSSQITSSRPNASIYVSADLKINDSKSTLLFISDYDLKKAESGSAGATRTGFIVTRAGSGSPFIEIYLYSGADSSYDELFVSVSGNKIEIPLYNSSLADMLPFGSLDTTILSSVLNSSLVVYDLTYKYKDESNGTRTRSYTANIDLKRSLVNLVNFITKNDYEEYTADIKALIGAIFGVNSDRLSAEMPPAALELEFTTTGGIRTDGEGTGKISALDMILDVSESDNKNTVFGGEAYSISIGLNKLDVKAAALDESVMPYRNDSKFDDYYMYDSRFVSVDGVVRFADGTLLGGKDYDIGLSFKYTGMDSGGNDDTIILKITDPDDANFIPFELNYADNILKLSVMERDESGSVKTGVFETEAYFTDFLQCLIDNYFDKRDIMNTFESLAFVFSMLNIDDSLISVKVDSVFFKKLLGLDMTGLYKCLHASCRGTGQIESKLKEAGIDLSKYVIDAAFDVTLDVSGSFFTVSDSLPVD